MTSRKSIRGRASLSFDAADGLLDMEHIRESNPWKEAKNFDKTEIGSIQNLLNNFNDMLIEQKRTAKSKKSTGIGKKDSDGNEPAGKENQPAGPVKKTSRSKIAEKKDGEIAEGKIKKKNGRVPKKRAAAGPKGDVEITEKMAAEKETEKVAAGTIKEKNNRVLKKKSGAAGPKSGNDVTEKGGGKENAETRPKKSVRKTAKAAKSIGNGQSTPAEKGEECNGENNATRGPSVKGRKKGGVKSAPRGVRDVCTNPEDGTMVENNEENNNETQNYEINKEKTNISNINNKSQGSWEIKKEATSPEPRDATSIPTQESSNFPVTVKIEKVGDPVANEETNCEKHTTPKKQNGRKQNVSKQNVLQENIPKENVPNANVPKENVPKENVPKESVPKESVPQENVPKENVPKENVPQENVPKESVPQENVPKQNAMKQTNKRHENHTIQESREMKKMGSKEKSPSPKENAKDKGNETTKRKTGEGQKRLIHERGERRRDRRMRQDACRFMQDVVSMVKKMGYLPEEDSFSDSSDSSCCCSEESSYSCSCSSTCYCSEYTINSSYTDSTASADRSAESE